MKEQATAIQKEPSGLRLVAADDLFAHMKEAFDAIARRAFEIFEANGKVFGRDVEDWFRAEAELLHPVHVKLAETDEVLTVQAEVPGFSAKEIEISVEPRRLTIAGKREIKKEEKKEKTIYSEHFADQVLRVVDLPAEVETGKVTATLKGAILQLTLPKTAQAKKIEVEPRVA